MKKFLILTISTILSSMALAAQTTPMLKCSIDDRISINLNAVDGEFQLLAHKAGGLELARAVGLQDIGRYWRYSTAAMEFASCKFSSEDPQTFECEGNDAHLTLGWPSYEDRFAKVSIEGTKTADGISISLRVQDEARSVDVTDRFYFKNSDCQSPAANDKLFPPKETSFSCDPKCVDGVPYCCIGSQCFKQQGKC